MNMKKQIKTIAGLSVLLALASCGGGGDIAGDSSGLAVFPKELTLSVYSDTEGDCSAAANDQGTVFTIVGGQAPYRIVNANPSGIAIDKTEATGKDPKFIARALGQCGDPFVLTILDYHSQATNVEIKVESKQPQ